jgi:tRNA threonylcarbamoyladenosine biosynthesis protein TsaE
VQLGKKLGVLLGSGDVVALFGEIGAGKTTIIKGIVAGLDVGSETLVTSPSFVIAKQYRGRIPVYHLDMYRCTNAEDLLSVGCEEYFYGGGVVLIEWAQNVQGILPDEYLRLEIEIAGDVDRAIRIVPLGQRYARRIGDAFQFQK